MDSGEGSVIVVSCVFIVETPRLQWRVMKSMPHRSQCLKGRQDCGNGNVFGGGVSISGKEHKDEEIILIRMYFIHV